MPPNNSNNKFTERSMINFYWLDYLMRIRNSGNRSLGQKEHQRIINVFMADKLVSDPRIKWTKVRERKKKGSVELYMKSKGIKYSRLVHPGWLEWERVKYPKDKNNRSVLLRDLLIKRGLDGPFGKYHYKYESKKGKISLILLKNYNFDGRDVWEIYAYNNGSLFTDTMRFDTKREAENEIIKLLKD